MRALGDTATTEGSWLRAWRTERPNDSGGAVMEAEALAQLAWPRRGTARAAQTSRQQLGAFHTMLQHAETSGWRAAEVATVDPTPWVSLINMAMGSGMRPKDFSGSWDDLTNRAPFHRAGTHTRAAVLV